MTDADRKDSPSGVLPRTVSDELDGWGESAEGGHRGMTPGDALPSHGRSIAIETARGKA